MANILAWEKKFNEIISQYGREYLDGQIITRIAEGDNPKDISLALGVPWVGVRRYIDQNLAEQVALAYRARADVVEYKGTNAVDEANPETVSVARLKSDYYLKLAERLDKKKYGIKDAQDSGGGNQQLPVFNVTFIGSGQIIQGECSTVVEPCLIKGTENE